MHNDAVGQITKMCGPNGSLKLMRLKVAVLANFQCASCEEDRIADVVFSLSLSLPLALR